MPTTPDQCPALLRNLLLMPSPTGSEQRIQKLIQDQFKGIAHHIEPDVTGNLVLALNPEAKRKVILAAHCDQIGFLVKYISEDGYLYVDPLGGVDIAVLPGEHLVIHNRHGAVDGVIGRKTVSFQGPIQTKELPPLDKMWLDIGATSRDEALETVAIGDYATFPLRITGLRNSCIAAPGLDNKAGLFVTLELLRRCAADGTDVGLYVVSSVQEEIGSRGAQVVANRVRPDIGIAVDVVPATDDPGYDLPPQSHPACRLRAGPSVSQGPNTNPVVGQMLIKAAQNASLAYQLQPCGKAAPNDSKVLQTADGGVAAGAAGIPLRNMHTQVEVVCLDDLEGTVAMLQAFIRLVNDNVDLRPLSLQQN